MEGFMGEPIILIVDDGPSISEVVFKKLQRAGYQVTVAHSGQAALDSSITSTMQESV
jgi:DNA-binding response OmpR family regulator